jgi:hypothetical protein
MSQPSWAKCSRILSLLTTGERLDLRSLKNGSPTEDISDVVLSVFKEHGLIACSAGTCELTADGQAVAGFC